MPIVRPKTDLKSSRCTPEEQQHDAQQHLISSCVQMRAGISQPPVAVCCVLHTVSEYIEILVGRLGHCEQNPTRCSSCVSSVLGQACPVDGELCAAHCGFSRVAKRTACLAFPFSRREAQRLRELENRQHGRVEARLATPRVIFAAFSQ